MAREILVELGSGDCPCCHNRVEHKKMVFADINPQSLNDLIICVDCYDKLHKKVMNARKKLASAENH